MSEKVEKSFFGLQIITIKSYLWYKSGYIFDHLSNKCIYHILNCRDLVLISMFGLQLNITFWYAIQVRPKSEDIAGHDDTRMWSFSKQKKNHRNVCQIDKGVVLLKKVIETMPSEKQENNWSQNFVPIYAFWLPSIILRSFLVGYSATNKPILYAHISI